MKIRVNRLPRAATAAFVAATMGFGGLGLAAPTSAAVVNPMQIFAACRLPGGDMVWVVKNSANLSTTVTGTLTVDGTGDTRSINLGPLGATSFVLSGPDPMTVSFASTTAGLDSGSFSGSPGDCASHYGINLVWADGGAPTASEASGYTLTAESPMEKLEFVWDGTKLVLKSEVVKAGANPQDFEPGRVETGLGQSIAITHTGLPARWAVETTSLVGISAPAVGAAARDTWSQNWLVGDPPAKYAVRDVRVQRIPSVEYRSFTPGRLLDSRVGGTTVDGLFQGIGLRAAGSVTVLTVAGRHGVPADAKAVVLNVTSSEAVRGGFVTVYPCDQGLPNASNLNFAAGQTIPNATATKLAADGTICLFTEVATQLLVDVAGHFPATSTFVPATPGRVLDSRTGGVTVDNTFAGIGRRTAGTITELQIGGRHGVPMTAKAVALNVTADAAAGIGFVTVFPCGEPVPNASNLNYVAGSTIANFVFAGLGTAGKVCLYTEATTDLIVDVNGYLPANSPFVSFVPGRLMDSRLGGSTVDGQDQGNGALYPGQTYELQVLGRYGIPSTAITVVLNVTAADAGSGGYITVYPCGTTLPNSSNLNYVRGSTIPNAVVTRVGANGKVCFFSEGGTQLLVDVSGHLSE